MTDNTFNPSGLLEMNGQAVSSISYSRKVIKDQARYTLVYRMGNKQVARIKDLTADQLDVAVGQSNADTIHRDAAEKGLLKGKTLQYANVRDPNTPAQEDPTLPAVDRAAAAATSSVEAPQVGEPATKQVSATVRTEVEAEEETSVADDRSEEEKAKQESAEAKAAREAIQDALKRELQAAFHQVDSKYFHRDNQNRVAFVDREHKLVSNAEADSFIAKSMVKLAEAKGWDSIKVSGTKEFRQAVWMEAQLRGINVAGYKPHETDLAMLAERKEAQLTNAIEQTPRTPAGQHASSPAEQVGEATEAPARGERLLTHGAARYMNDADEKLSYFVTTVDDAGNQKTTWGIDLGRAMSESGAVQGDYVKLHNLGSRAVMVDANVRDETGKVVGVEPKEVHRNEWNVEVDRKAKHRDAAAAFRAASTPAERKEAAQAHPDLTGAFGQAAALKKFAEVSLPMSQQHDFMKRQIDNIASDIEKGAKIGSVKIAVESQPRKEVEASQER
ncbi:LPD7 domain-containing protein [Xanthomonas euvesicatoria]|uniref:LPD7 domain-containing protein n=1 Tax=Xanthomonas euvesicatoria TaxID=456327 RepID=UPI001C470715|nr:LPD7 domain-containing protein [Xanthomonas euvesicatoria]MBV6867909.1 hypothetical protein [Xanthomonas campestris pv. coriandri]MCE4330829.1 hypothetical protein [Xanthomonas campestris pv. coriandri]